MRFILGGYLGAFLLLGLFAGPAGAKTLAGEEKLESVVKIYSKNRSVNLSSPWRRQTPRTVTGSGVILEPGRVLTVAHLVLYTTEILLQPADSSERVPAKVKYIAPGIDLAVLEYEPEGRLQNVEPLPLARKSPTIKSTVRVYGYPTGGETQSVTEGIVSRIEYTRYRYGAQGMRIQIDAAINPGNSGGPAIVNGEIAGLAFSIRRSANDIGYVIPTEEIQRFLRDVKKDGRYDGKPSFNVSYQYLENRTLRRKLQVPADVTGVLCRGVRGQPDSPLKEGDVIIRIDDYEVDNRGRCRFQNDVTLTFTQLATEIVRDNQVSLTILRNGQKQTLTVPLETRPRLIGYLAGRYPRYFVYGPVVFSEATADYLAAITTALASSDSRHRRTMSAVRELMEQAESPLLRRRTDRRDPSSGEELVVVTRLLPHESVRGYRPILYFYTVQSVNGEPVKNLQALVELLRDAQGPFVEIRFHDSIADILVLDRQQALDVTEDVLESNGIFRQGSPDLMRVWRGG
ncbi:MAG: serine protease [Planctomycetes bacterium]|nr:serine protease [Planctomycetota bacterium]